MAEHTPGPWAVVARGTARLDRRTIRRNVTGGAYVGEIRPAESDDPARVLANGHLIAAAPQLLDSLLAVEWAGSDDGQDFPDQIDCCPNCGAPEEGGRHFTNCELRDSLDAALGVTSPRLERADG